jgi:hypothetical protein
VSDNKEEPMFRIAYSSRLIVVAVLAVAAMALTAGAALAAPGVPGPPAATPGAAKQGQTAAPPLTGAEAELSKKQEKLVAVAQKLADKARDRGSDIAGVSIDAETGTVDLFRKDKAKGHGLDSVPAGVKVDVHAAKFSRAEMIGASEQITQDAQVLGQQHVTVMAVGPTVDGAGVDVTVFATGADDVGKASKLLHDRYGAIVDDVRGSAKKTSEAELYFAGWRFNDFAPWYGGDRIANSSLSCTTGFAATYNGAPAMLTAAHCGGVGTNFWNGPTTSGGWNFMGTVNYSNTNTDVASIGVTSASNYINVGYNPQVATQLYVGSWASPIVGESLCQSGSFTGERCGLQVVDTGQYVCLSYFLWWCTSWQGPLADVISSYGSGSPAAGHGDSGGPVFLRTSTTSGIAKGLVHGQLTPNARAAYPAYYPDTLSCPSPDYVTSNRCSSGFSFAHMPGY